MNPYNIPFVANISDLKALGAASSQYTCIYVRGYYTDGDGGEGVFSWNPSSTTSSNDGTIISATGVSTGRWIRQTNGLPYSVRWFGAKGDNSTDDTSACQAAIDAANTDNVRHVFFPSGDYLITTITIPNTVYSETINYIAPFRLTGVSPTASVLYLSGSGPLIKPTTITTTSGCSFGIENLGFTFSGTRSTEVAILVDGVSWAWIHYCNFVNFNYCIKCSVSSQTNDLDVRWCWFNLFDTGIYFGKGSLAGTIAANNIIEHNNFNDIVSPPTAVGIDIDANTSTGIVYNTKIKHNDFVGLALAANITGANNVFQDNNTDGTTLEVFKNGVSDTVLYSTFINPCAVGGSSTYTNNGGADTTLIDPVNGVSQIGVALKLVADLPLASASSFGTVYAVSDATSTTFGSPVSGGGSNKVKVYNDGGGNWRIGGL